ncbi:hypothetical protein HZS_674 [Henneguya salminicola]|nr:hypothetical protein HZS_674 [Henneguya salminicola]
MFGDYKNSKMGKLFSIACILHSIGNTFTLFLSGSSRNSSTLQAILMNSHIPLTVIIRYFFLKRIPNLRRAICVVLVLVGLGVCVVPNFISNQILDEKVLVSQEATFSKLLHLPDTLVHVCMEKIYRDGDTPLFTSNVSHEDNVNLKYDDSVNTANRSSDIYYYCLVLSIFQLGTTILFFWVDLVQYLGYSYTMSDFVHKYVFIFIFSLYITLDCTKAEFPCSWETTGYAAGYLASSFIGLMSSMLLLRAAINSVLHALIMNLVTPLIIIFWMLFSSNPLKWNPHFDKYQIYVIVGACIIIPSVIIYNIGDDEDSKHMINQK